MRRVFQKASLLWIAFCLGVAICTAADRDWSAFSGDPTGSHYSTLRQINTRNVQRLQPAWTFHCGDGSTNNRSQIQCNPLVIDGVLYGTSPQLKLFALDAASGRELWRFDPFALDLDPNAIGVNRGLVMWRDGAERRLLLTAGHYIHAIDPGTGRLVTGFGQGGRVDLRQGLDRDVTGLYVLGTTPGAIYKDLLIISTRVGEGPGPAAPGHIRAYDVRTGKRRWIFHTIPWPGEPGYETWPPDAYLHTGGANCWAGLVVDRQSGVAYVPTGSAAFDFWGGDRIGRNLYADCLLALDAATGQRKWHFQTTRHDLWDRDLPAAPVLVDVRHNGRKVAAVAQTTKAGHVWLFDRKTGAPLFPWQERGVPPSDLAGEVAWTNQPVPLKPAPYARQQFTEDEVTDISAAAHDAVLKRLRECRPHQPFDPPSTRGTIVFPGFDGGGEWGGAAVDPKSGVLFVNANEMAWILQMVPVAKGEGPGGGARTIYSQMCGVCHGQNREGNAAQNVPPLVNIGQRMKAADIVSLLGTGKNVMPSFDFLRPSEKEGLARLLLGTGSADDGVVNDAAHKSEPAGDSSRSRSPYATTGYNRFLDPQGYPAVKPPWGTLNAIDLNSGEFRWKVPLGELPELTAKGIPPTGTENYGGPMVTAGGLVFIAASKDEKFRAFDEKTGRKLWQAQLPAGGYATPASYSVKGRQFVVIACGGGKMGTKSGDSYEAFALP